MVCLLCMENQQVTLQNVIDILQKQNTDHTDLMGFLAEHMVTREEFRSLEGDVKKLDVKINQVKLDLLDAMDEKLGALKGDLVVMMRGEDQKLMFMVQKLKEKKIFDDSDVNEFLAMLPFPQIVRPS